MKNIFSCWVGIALFLQLVGTVSPEVRGKAQDLAEPIAHVIEEQNKAEKRVKTIPTDYPTHTG